MTNQEKIEALENTGMIDRMLFDYTVFLNTRFWLSKAFAWSRWIRM